MSHPVYHSVTPASSDHSLLRQLRDGQDHAASELHTRYAERILQLARARLSRDLSPRLDAEDIVQSVFSSFFRGVNLGFYNVPPDEELWGLFLVITLNKIRARGNFHRAARRDIRRTHGRPEEEGGARAGCHEIAVVDLQSVIEWLLQDLSEDYRETILLRIEGFQVDEIATRVQRSRRTVERMLQDFRQRLGQVLKEDGHDPSALA